MTLWFTADLHLSHERINELAQRPFGSVEEADETMIDRWNEVVGPYDTVWVLGDLAMGPIIDSMAKAARLKGRKTLVPGNHDRVHPAYRQSTSQRLRAEDLYTDAGFTIAPQSTTLSLGSILVDVCHFPFQDSRYPEWCPPDNLRTLLHGHVHNAWKFNGRQINVGVDMWDFRPVNVEELLPHIVKVLL